MEWSYWKVICMHGHVGRRKEVSVARHLRLPLESTLFDAMAVAENMPGVKNKGVYMARKITHEEYSIGLQKEENNLYLLKLKSFSKGIA